MCALNPTMYICFRSDNSLQRKEQRCKCRPRGRPFGIDPNGICRYCSAVVYGPYLCFDQFCIVPILGEKDTTQPSFGLTNHATGRITPRPLYFSETLTRASSSPRSFTSCSPTFPRTRKNKRKSFASMDYLARTTANANGRARNLRNGFSPSDSSSPGRR